MSASATTTAGAVPEWVARHADRLLPPRSHILNGRAIHGGRLGGLWLINTSDGAVLVKKSSIGEPKGWHLSYPENRFLVHCTHCDEAMQFIATEAPRPVFCTRCGHEHRLDAFGVLRSKEAKPAPAAPASRQARPRGPTGPFRHNGYTLHGREVQLKRGGTQTIYFFSKKKPKSGTPCAKPDGYEVGENKRTGLPYLRKTDKKKQDDREKHYRPQCGAVTPAGRQCRNSARKASKYCASHKSYRPPFAEQVKDAVDTVPRIRLAKDTAPSKRKGHAAKHKEAAVCAAQTQAGTQCTRHSREGSKYCGIHKGHRATAEKALTA